MPIDRGLAAWCVGAVSLSLAAGLLVGAAPAVAFDLSVIAVTALAVRRHPLTALIVVLVLRAAIPNSVLLVFLTLGGGAVALILNGRLPERRVSAPFLALTLVALASAPLLPSVDEGLTAGTLTLPFVHAPYAKTPSSELFLWMNLASVLVVFCLAASAVRTHAQLRRLVGAILVSAVAPIAIGAQQLATGQTVARGATTLKAVRGPFTFPNYFAFYLVVVLIVAIVVLLETTSLRVRVALAVLVALTGTALFFTYTRAAWVGFGVALVVLALTRYRRLTVVAVVMTVLAVLLAPGAVHKAEQRFGDLSTQSQAAAPNSWTWRVDEWEAILPYGYKRPLAGQGFGSYSRMTVRRYGRLDRRYPTVEKPERGVFSPLGFTAHNDYVRMFVELGVPGLLLWVLVFVGALASAVRARRVRGLEGPATALIAIVFALLLISASDNLQGYSVVLISVFALCGGVSGVATSARQARRPGSTVPSRQVVGVDLLPGAPSSEPRAPAPDAPLGEPTSTKGFPGRPSAMLLRGTAVLRAAIKRRRRRP